MILILKVHVIMKTVFINFKYKHVAFTCLCFCDTATKIKKINCRIILYDWYTILRMDTNNKEITKLISQD